MYDFAKLTLSDSLSGFLKGHACTTALLKMTDDFRASLDNKDHCIAIAVDLSKAFDSISHSLLIYKLKAYGFTESAVNLIRSYLHDRLQRGKIGNNYSNMVFLKDQYWDLSYSTYSLMISLILSLC